MKKGKSSLAITAVLALCLQWVYFRFWGAPLSAPWNAILPGIAIFAASFLLSWGAELAQFYIPRSLAIAFLALIAVLPEYAVDMYFAWQAGKHPRYIHYATANMTGANRLIIGLGWATVVFAYLFRSKKSEVRLETTNRTELFALTLATLYCFIIPFKHSLTLVDTFFLLGIFGWYLYQASRSHHEEPELEGPIAFLADWPSRRRLAITLLFFLFSGFMIFICAEPFAEGLLATGRHLKIDEFILVQWLAPLASESPEFIVAILFALKQRADSSIGALISSTVNQWTLLIGMLPLVYAISGGHLGVMPLDGRQAEEIFLTAAQSLLAVVILANWSFGLWEAVLLLGLFATQLCITVTWVRVVYAVAYVVLSFGYLFLRPYRRSLIDLLTHGWRSSPPAS